jgi:hypothetical protein
MFWERVLECLDESDCLFAKKERKEEDRVWAGGVACIFGGKQDVISHVPAMIALGAHSSNAQPYRTTLRPQSF